MADGGIKTDDFPPGIITLEETSKCEVDVTFVKQYAWHNFAKANSTLLFVLSPTVAAPDI